MPNSKDDDDFLTLQEFGQRVSPLLVVLVVGAGVPDQGTLNVLLRGQWSEAEACKRSSKINKNGFINKAFHAPLLQIYNQPHTELSE